jgi:hypothetical protein
VNELKEAGPPAPDDPALRAAETLARWLDGRFLDPLMGLFLPGVGDLLGSALGLYPVLLAGRRRAQGAARAHDPQPGRRRGHYENAPSSRAEHRLAWSRASSILPT